MQVKYPLCQLFTLEFLLAIIDLAYGSNTEAALHSARNLATVDGLIWG
jgi:hypothetical protein